MCLERQETGTSTVVMHDVDIASEQIFASVISLFEIESKCQI